MFLRGILGFHTSIASLFSSVVKNFVENFLTRGMMNDRLAESNRDTLDLFDLLWRLDGTIININISLEDLYMMLFEYKLSADT
jgi:hypothetical protein